MDGFFSGAPLRPIVDTKDESVDKFAQAIAGRFNNADRPLLTTRLTPAELDAATPLQRRFRAASSDGKRTPATPPALPNPPTKQLAMPPRPTASTSSTNAHPPSSFAVVKPSSLPQYLEHSQDLVILDIRAHSSFATARIGDAISLSVPSTLLKRPAYTLERIGNMLSSISARKRFSTWNSASRILVYDADSTTLNEGSNILGLLRKFRNESFKGELAWLHGGIQSVWKGQRALINSEPLVEEEDENNDTSGFLRARDLPASAFTSSSTTMTRGPSVASPSSLHNPANDSSSKVSAMPMRLSRSGGKGVDLSPTIHVTAANPFYDNIRQNRELSHGMTERIPLKLSDRTAARLEELPFTWLRDIARHAGDGDSTEALAMQFYRIELGEQRRLQGVLSHHSMAGMAVLERKDKEEKREIVQASKAYPYSILAGFEKGAKNRYRDIWPFEHTRVKLKTKSSDDYINASYVQPLSTRRRYIATQGPLPSTFNDFWSIVWEQDVRVIVMLTKQFEGGSVKCGQYWANGQYGPLTLKCISASGALDEDSGGGAFGNAGGFFDSPSDGNETDLGGKHNNTIRRVFEIRHASYPDEPPRVVRQMQYVGWPDMDVPINPKGLIKFMSEVDALVDSVNQISLIDLETPHTSPALLHCSAGVGRTGSFIIIDAVLDGVRREIRRRAELKKSSSSSSSQDDSDRGTPERMEVDSSSREASMAPTPSVPESTTVASSLPRNATPTSSAERPKLHSGPTATLHIGGTKSRGGGNDIHVPVVAQGQEAMTPKPQELAELAPTSCLSPSNAPQQFVRSPSDMASHGHTSHFNTTRRTLVPGSRRHLSHHRPGHNNSRVHTDFTEADADSMFTSESSNPAFAMDVESVQPIPRWAAGGGNGIGGNSSSGEGTTGSISGGDKSSGSGSGSGRSRRSAFIAPISQALARLSSADDVPGPTERQDGELRRIARLPPRGRAGSGSGSGSGEASMSSSGGGSASGSGSGRGSGSSFGGYTSSSSLGLRTFAGLELTNGTSPSPMLSGSTGGEHTNKDEAHALRTFTMKPPNMHGQLHAPKPMHPLQQPEIIEASLMKKRMTERSRLRHHHGSSQSQSISSSSAPSTDVFSSASSPPNGTSSETPLSTHEFSHPSSPNSFSKFGASSSSNQQSTQDAAAERLSYDFVEPRALHHDDSPPLLSSFEEPIREILEDMREQRMSLCQSLRQYVFVHKAIIEGSLRIVDEERRRAGIAEDDADFDPSKMLPELSTTVIAGKRGASPTELPKEDRKGDVALAKRPSFRRAKSTSSGDSGGST